MWEWVWAHPYRRAGNKQKQKQAPKKRATCLRKGEEAVGEEAAARVPLLLHLPTCTHASSAGSCSRVLFAELGERRRTAAVRDGRVWTKRGVWRGDNEDAAAAGEEETETGKVAAREEDEGGRDEK